MSADTQEALRLSVADPAADAAISSSSPTNWDEYDDDTPPPPPASPETAPAASGPAESARPADVSATTDYSPWNPETDEPVWEDSPDGARAEVEDAPVRSGAFAAPGTASAPATASGIEKASESVSDGASADAASGGSGVRGQDSPDSPAPDAAEPHPAPYEAAGMAAADGGGATPPPPDAPEDAKAEEEGGGRPMGLLDHLSELRRRLTWCLIAATVGFFICWSVVEPLFDILTMPLKVALDEVGAHAQYTTMPEAFFTRMLVAFVVGLFLAGPVIFYQIWAFVAPGLYDEEKRWLLPIAFISAVFFAGGGLFCYNIVFPFAFSFFISFSTESIQITPRIGDYLDFILKLLLAFGLIFEMPLFTFFLSRMGILTADMMRRARRYAVLGVFIIAAILTPPDVISQLLMALPMLLLYEGSILVAALFGRKRKADPPANDDTGKEAA